VIPSVPGWRGWRLNSPARRRPKIRTLVSTKACGHGIV